MLVAYARQSLHHRVAERLAPRVVPAAVERIRRVLDEDAHHVFPGRRHAGIDHRGNHDVHVRLLRELAVLGPSWRARGYSTLGLIETAPRRCGPTTGRQVKFGSPESARFTLPEEPPELVAAHALDQIVGQDTWARRAA